MSRRIGFGKIKLGVKSKECWKALQKSGNFKIFFKAVGGATGLPIKYQIYVQFYHKMFLKKKIYSRKIDLHPKCNFTSKKVPFVGLPTVCQCEKTLAVAFLETSLSITKDYVSSIVLY